MRRRAGQRAAFLYALLVLVCYGQVVWWFLYQLDRTREAERLQVELLVARAAAGEPIAGAGLEARAAALHARTRQRTRMFIAEGAFFLAVITAGTGLLHLAHRRERRLRQRQDELIKAVSHEFNTPLQALRLSLETMAARDLPGDRRERYLQRMTGDVDRLAAMVDELLEAQRLEATAPAPPEPCSLGDAAAAALAGLGPRLRAAGMTVEVTAEGPSEVLGRPAELARAATVLLENALKYAAGGGRVDIIHGARDGRRAYLAVTDAGPGLTLDDQRIIFARFARGTAARRGTVPGTGLGLAIAQRIVTEHGGTLTATSRGPGQGARFEIVLPAASRRGAAARRTGEAPA
ncbi:MAG: sensor histidine kinase [Candidatus Krumholzibacteriia bacterium]